MVANLSGKIDIRHQDQVMHHPHSLHLTEAGHRLALPVVRQDNLDHQGHNGVAIERHTMGRPVPRLGVRLE